MKIVSREPVEKGFSSDQKYRVIDKHGTSYLLRETNINQKVQKMEEFRIMQTLADKNLSMCRPVKLWWDKETVYTLHTWVDGEDLQIRLPELLQRDQYVLGLEAGRQLRIIHSIAAPDGSEVWAERYKQKIERTLEAYAKCPVKLETEAFFLRLAQPDWALLTRPTTLQHGDFHRGNLMLDQRGQLVVIDFQKFSWGDPWEEFDSITWDVQLAPDFARGRVDGYFDGAVPETFWQLLRYYVCRGILNGWAWAASRGQEQVQIMEQHAAMVQRWYADGGVVPNWYFDSRNLTR